MTEAYVKKAVKGRAAIDGAGVHLTRVLGYETVKDFDPILMLDSFDAKDPEMYIKGFPMHPHRGIETVTYLSQGRIDHQDSLGNSGSIINGDVQWMTAGSGILHSEFPKPSERMLGLQFWLNLPASEKMTEPKYFDIKAEDIPEAKEDGAVYKVISGTFKGVTGAKPHHIQAKFVDAMVDPDTEVSIPLDEKENHFVFLLEGNCRIGDTEYDVKSALLLSEGDEVKIRSLDTPLHFMFIEGPRLNEGIAWGGPIVMNTREELQQAFRDLDNGTFIKDKPSGI